MINTYENEPGMSPKEENKTGLTPREKMDSTIEKIGEKINMSSIGASVGKSLGVENIEDAAKVVGAKMKENPVPAVLIGTGLAWLFWPKPSPATRARAHGVKDSIGSEIGKVKHKAHDAKEYVGQEFDSFKDSASGVKDKVTANVEEFAHSVASSAQTAGNAARDSFTSTAAQLERAYEAQPLVAALGAFVAGIVAGVIPRSSRVEDDLVGSYSDRIKKGVSDEADEALRRGREAVNETVESAVEEAERKGLTFQGLKDRATEAAVNIKDEAVEIAHEKVEETSASVKSQANEIRDDLKEGDS